MPKEERKYLLISPYFPPATRIGAKRALHLTRHLPAHGWRPVVLAAPPLGNHTDEALWETVPKETNVSFGFHGGGRALGHGVDRLTREGLGDGSLFSVGSVEPRKKKKRSVDKKQPWRQLNLLGWNVNYLTPFDRYLGDVPAAVWEGRRLIRDHGLEAIQVSADPWSGLIVGWVLHLLTGLPLLPDLRDPWSLHEGKMAMRPAPTRWLLRQIEAEVFRRSAKIIVNTENAREAYVESYRGLIPEERFVAIRNAFDGEMLKEHPFESPEAFTVLYFGRFRLFFEPDSLLQGFKAFVDKLGLAPEEARFTFVGRLRDKDLEKIDAVGLRAYVDNPGYVSLLDSLRVLRAAHVLLMVVEPSCRLQNPGKLYDYLASRRPVLAVSANSEVNEILTSTGAGEWAPFGDPLAMAERLEGFYERWRAGDELVVDPEDVEEFSARKQAKKVAAVLNEVTA